MTDTILIVPVNQDTRPTSFSYSFANKTGVKVNLTVNTRDEGVALSVVEDVVDHLGWTIQPTNDEITMGQIPLYVAGAALVFGVALFFGLFVLMMAGWLPIMESSTVYANDRMDTVFWVMKMYLRAALIVYVPITASFMIFKHFSDRSASADPDKGWPPTGIDETRGLNRPLPE